MRVRVYHCTLKHGKASVYIHEVQFHVNRISTKRLPLIYQKVTELIYVAVALNFQTAGTEMDVYQGRFQDNGFSGYVLKPEFLRDEQTKFNPKSITEGTWGTKKKLLLKVRIEVGKCLSNIHPQGGCVGCTFSFSWSHLGNVILNLLISHHRVSASVLRGLSCSRHLLTCLMFCSSRG